MNQTTFLEVGTYRSEIIPMSSWACGRSKLPVNKIITALNNVLTVNFKVFRWVGTNLDQHSGGVGRRGGVGQGGDIIRWEG